MKENILERLVIMFVLNIIIAGVFLIPTACMVIYNLDTSLFGEHIQGFFHSTEGEYPLVRVFYTIFAIPMSIACIFAGKDAFK